jgi:hypothetical protein
MSARRADAGENIRALVSGLLPSLRGRQVFVMLQAFLDESETPPVFVLAGYSATVDQWEAFSREWEFALRSWGLPAFKMQEAATWDEQTQNERIGYLVHLIYQHITAYYASALDAHLLKRIFGRVVRSRTWSNPYYFSFLMMAGMILDHVDPKDEIEFIFDDRVHKKWVRGAFERAMSGAPESWRNKLVGEPRFAQDERYPALQAADLLAWNMRRTMLESYYGKEQLMRQWADGVIEKPGLAKIWTQEDMLIVLKQLAKQEHIDITIERSDTISIGALSWRLTETGWTKI